MISMVSRRRKGFILSELLLAMAIIAFALGALMLGFITSSFLNESSRNLTHAITHAQYVMEEIKDTNFNNIKTKIDNGDWYWDTQAINARGLTALSNETVYTAANGTDLLDITVTVGWDDRGGRYRSIALETLIAEP